MAKISLNISDDLDNILRNYAKDNDLTLTDACTSLFKQALQVDSSKAQEYDKLQLEYEIIQEKYNVIQDKNEELRMKLDKEKQARIDDYQTLIAQNIATNKHLLDIMKADRILQIDKKTKSRPLLEKIKSLFSPINKKDK